MRGPRYLHVRCVTLLVVRMIALAYESFPSFTNALHQLQQFNICTKKVGQLTYVAAVLTSAVEEI